MNKNFKLFINHNKKIFKNNKNDYNGQILVEFNNWSSTHISASYLGNVLSEKYNAKIIAYEGYTLISSKLNLSIIDKLKYFFSKKIFGKYYKVYKSFNVKKFIRPNINNYIFKKSNKKFFSLINSISSKKKLLDLKIEGILIGDLIYDTFLKIKKIPTIDINSKSLKNYINESIMLFYFWVNYFNNHNIKSVIIVHPTYLYGIIMRIACQKKIPVYRAHANGIEYIKVNNYHTGKNFRNYLKYFESIKDKNNTELLNNSKITLEKILKKKTNSKNLNKFKNKINKNKKISVLIAMHNFYDSPHVFGNMLFPDFYEWLKYLVKISQNTNYNWYLKLHPENDIKDFKSIKQLLGDKSKIKILPSKTSDKSILRKNIQFVLTCYGTIGYEYAYLGLTVINACKFNPHYAFNFNLNPKNRSEYTNILKNLKRHQIVPSKKEILKFFYIRRFFLSNNWLGIKKKKLRNIFRWQKEIYRPDLYSLWVNSWNLKKHNSINYFCKKFIESKKNIAIVAEK